MALKRVTYTRPSAASAEPRRVGGRRGRGEASGVTLGGTASGADLGGSSKYSSETLEGRSWRKVPCEQQLDMG